jgi:hypothetical protein
MMERIAGISPVLKARVAGAFYLLSIVTGMLGATTTNAGLGLAANLAGIGCYVVVTAILYDLLKPVNATLSLLAAISSLAGCTIGILTYLHLPKPGINELVFFGFYCLLLAYLIFKSTFLPRFLSVLLALTGIGWLTFLSPALGERLFVPYLMIGGLAGEGSLTLWLLIAGVNGPRWNEQARRAE